MRYLIGLTELHGQPLAARAKLSGMPLPLTPDTRLADHRDAYVELRCRGCGHFREMRTEALARLIGWETLLAKRLGRFRCSRCGARSVAIAFGYDCKPRGWLKNH